MDDAYSEEVTQVEKQGDGSTHVTVSISYPKGGSFKTVFAVSDTALSMVGEGELKLAKPVLQLKLPLTVGTKWEELRTRYEVTAEEEVEVPAGKYRAAKVEMTKGTGVSTLWYAPGVGLLRMTSETSPTALELKAFKPGK